MTSLNPDRTLSTELPLILVLFICVLSVACGDGLAVDAGLDVGGDSDDVRDVFENPDTFEEPDVPRVRDASPDTSGPRVWHHEPQLEVLSTECEDWDSVPRMPRALPEDATPRVLWRYRPGLDPLYDFGRADGRSYVGEQPVVSPDGTVWVHGPRAADVTQVSRDGRMRRWFRVGGQDENDPEIRAHLARQLLALPDGVVVAAVYSMYPDYPMGYLARMNPDRPFPGATDDERAWSYRSSMSDHSSLRGRAAWSTLSPATGSTPPAKLSA